MKTLLLTLAVFLIAFIIGCEENSVTQPDPVLGKKDIPPQKETLKICCAVQDPLSGVCNVNGSVFYVHHVINPHYEIGLFEISLYLEIDAEMCDRRGMVHLEWGVNDKSQDIVYVSEEGILLFEKSYNISNRSDVVLLVRYIATTDSVGISNICIAPVEK